MHSDRRDAAWAVAAATIAFGVYLRTLAPGMVGVLDTPMFQFIGRVLGVAHNPGYPLYVLLTYPFSYLPIGSLAYRINLFSALLGAVAVGLTFCLARRLECRRIVAFAAALGLGFGEVFWSQAVIAEVYTLHAAIIAGVLLSLIVWAQTGRAGCYYTAVALFAAGLGNHTTIVGFAPGIAVFVLLTNRAFVLRWRTAAVTAAILVIGLLQYAFVLIRSLDPDAYVESRATTVAALIDVMTGGQFRDRLFAFGWRTVVFDRLPFLFERVIASEMTLPALGAAALGAVWLLRRRLPEALLLLLGMGAILGFAINYSVVDTPVFVIPAILVLWIAAGVGVEQLARWGTRLGRWAGSVLPAAALVVPAWLLGANLTGNDQSREYASAMYLDALFGVLPDRTALVHEDFLIDRMVMSRLLDEDAPNDRRIAMVERDPADVRGALDAGRSVFAFTKSARRLRYDALDVSFAPIPLLGGTFEEFLSRLPRGSAVAMAMPASLATRLGEAAVAMRAIGGTPAADLAVATARRIGASRVVARMPIDLHADATGATIRLGGRDLVRTFEGATVAVFTPDGRLDQAFAIEAATEFRVPLPIGPLSIYPVHGRWHGQEFESREWRDVSTACRTGTVMLRIPAGQTAVLYLADDAPLAVRLIEKSQNGVTAQVTEVAPGRLYRIEVAVSGLRDASVLVALGGIPTRAVARVQAGSGAAASAAILSVDIAGLLRRPDRRSALLLMARDEQSQLTGDGWSAVDFDAAGPYRWMTASESRLVLPIGTPDATAIRVQALRRDDRGGPVSMALRINGTVLPPQLMEPGWRAYEWRIPDAVLHAGTNEMTIRVDRPPGEKGIAVSDVRLERRD
jgi:hypothetical protein